MSKGVHVDSIQILEALCLALSIFASDCKDVLETSDSEIQRKIELLEARCHNRARKVEYWQQVYDDADPEEDDISRIAYKLDGAEEEYQRARQWLRRVEEITHEYTRSANRVKEISDHRIVEACTFLRQKISELKDYVALQPDGFSINGFGGLSATSSNPDTSRLITQKSLKNILGEDRYTDYANKINDIKANNPILQDIPTDNLIAIRGYTSDGHYAINKALRSQDAMELQKYDSYIRAAVSGLNQMPEYSGTVYRGIEKITEEEAEAIASQYKKDKVITERGFTSASADPTRQFKGLVQYVIKSQHGKDVSQIALYSEEKEVLFPPNTQFKVFDIRKNPSTGITTIYMDEVTNGRD